MSRERTRRAPRRPAADQHRVLLRIDPALIAAVKRLAAEERRSMNRQIEHMLERALEQQTATAA